MSGSPQAALLPALYPGEDWNLGPFVALFVFVVHLMLAVAVHQDARRRVDRMKRVLFIGPLAWSAAVLLGGLAGLGLYWVMHYSTLREREETASNP